MTTKKEFIHATEKAGVNIDLYLSTHDEGYLSRAMNYVRAANVLIKEMTDDED